MKLFIAGGLGFIGTYLARTLSNQGNEVLVYDNQSYFHRSQKLNYATMLQWRQKFLGKKVKMIIGDIRNRIQLRSAIIQFKPDIVVHLAALSVANKNNQNKKLAYSINLHGTELLLKTMIEPGTVRKFLYFSSSYVYGNFAKDRLPETALLHPIDTYGQTKLEGEKMTRSHCKANNINFVIIRPSAVYGYGDVNQRVISKFMSHAIQGHPLTVYNPNERLDFTHVQDVVDGTLLCIHSPKANNQIFNLTYGRARSLAECSQIFKKFFPDLQIQIKKNAGLRPKRGTLSIVKAKKLLGYHPKISLEKGITDFFNKMCVYG